MPGYQDHRRILLARGKLSVNPMLRRRMAGCHDELQVFTVGYLARIQRRRQREIDGKHNDQEMTQFPAIAEHDLTGHELAGGTTISESFDEAQDERGVLDITK